ncbi:hypothetical protein ACFLXV_02230, partial [Chloroflexota bacterium]
MLDLFGDEKRRKNFTMTTKKIEWLKAAGRDPEGKFYQTSQCRNPKCKVKLTWGDGRYNFDHKDNNSANNRQSNCYLVCRNCHGAATKIAKQKVIEPFLGTVIGYKTIKKKVSYKKPKKTTTKTPAKKKKKKADD